MACAWGQQQAQRKEKKTTSEQEMNLPHSSWLGCTPTPKAAIILWPAHVGILRVVSSAFSWLVERGQGLFVPWLVHMQLSSKHFGSLFGSIFVMWKCVHVCKLVLVSLVTKLDFSSDFIWNLKSSLWNSWEVTSVVKYHHCPSRMNFPHKLFSRSLSSCGVLFSLENIM